MPEMDDFEKKNGSGGKIRTPKAKRLQLKNSNKLRRFFYFIKKNSDCLYY